MIDVIPILQQIELTVDETTNVVNINVSDIGLKGLKGDKGDKGEDGIFPFLMDLPGLP
jgi:hypothetical protein